MKEEELSMTLKGQAVSLGLCKEWTEGWGNPDPQQLIDKYLHGIDFCIKHDYPGNEFIKRNFDKELLHKNGIFVDEEVHLRNVKGRCVLNGRCKGMLLFDGLSVCDLYVRHGSEVVIDCSRLSKVFINVYDQAKVKVKQVDAASVYVYKHGEQCAVDIEGDVMIRMKN